jgi:hypothetical protein
LAVGLILKQGQLLKIIERKEITFEQAKHAFLYSKAIEEQFCSRNDEIHKRSW